jgi:hypothetical protein
VTQLRHNFIGAVCDHLQAAFPDHRVWSTLTEQVAPAAFHIICVQKDDGQVMVILNDDYAYVSNVRDRLVRYHDPDFLDVLVCLVSDAFRGGHG